MIKEREDITPEHERIVEKLKVLGILKKRESGIISGTYLEKEHGDLLTEEERKLMACGDEDCKGHLITIEPVEDELMNDKILSLMYQTKKLTREIGAIRKQLISLTYVAHFCSIMLILSFARTGISGLGWIILALGLWFLNEFISMHMQKDD